VILHAPLALIAVLFGASLLALPMDGLSAAPLGIAERAAYGFVSADAGAGVTLIALAD
jgi:hypothetical protein